MLKKLFRLIPALFILLVFSLLVGGCASTPVIKMPMPLPDIVREYKNVRLYPGGMDYKAGLKLKEGEYFTIIAKGALYKAPGNEIFSPTWMISGNIENKGFNWLYGGSETIFLNARQSGELILRIDPYIPGKYYGSFDVDIIVWKKNDPVQIADFLKKLSLEDPENETLKDYVQDIEEKKKVILAEQKVTEEIEDTKKTILAIAGVKSQEITIAEAEKRVSEPKVEKLQEEVKQLDKILKEKGPGIKDSKEMAGLNERLQKAFQTLKELEEMRKRPIIIIAAPRDGVQVETESVPLYGVVEHEKGIAHFEILVNGVVAGRRDQRDLKQEAQKLPRMDFSERILLKDGKNEIAIIVRDVDGIVAKKSIAVQRVKKRGEVWAVVIGINKYRKFPHLKYSVNDAREFYRYLVEVNQVPKENIWLLLDEEATLENVKSVLGTQVRRKAGKDDMVIVYLAGHGATERDAASLDGDGLEKYFLPYNADPKDLYASAMPMGEVARIFQRINSERLVFISDTCYSGASGGRTVPITGIRANLSGTFLDRLSQGKGRMILTASDANEVSMEKDEFQHGVFTYYLLEALRGRGDLDGNGIITLEEVYHYVSTKVPQATGQDQHPVKKGEMTGQIVLGVVK